MHELYGRLQEYFERYNDRRPHSSRDDRTPSEMFFGTMSATLTG